MSVDLALLRKARPYVAQVDVACYQLGEHYWPCLPRRMPAAERLHDFKVNFLDLVRVAIDGLLAKNMDEIDSWAHLKAILTDPRPIDSFLTLPRANSKIMQQHGEAIRAEVDKIREGWKQLRECVQWDQLANPGGDDLLAFYRKQIDEVRDRKSRKRKKASTTDEQKEPSDLGRVDGVKTTQKHYVDPVRGRAIVRSTWDVKVSRRLQSKKSLNPPETD